MRMAEGTERNWYKKERQTPHFMIVSFILVAIPSLDAAVV